MSKKRNFCFFFKKIIKRTFDERLWIGKIRMSIFKMSLVMCVIYKRTVSKTLLSIALCVVWPITKCALDYQFSQRKTGFAKLVIVLGQKQSIWGVFCVLWGEELYTKQKLPFSPPPSSKKNFQNIFWAWVHLSLLMKISILRIQRK